jgi:hypothetical protein
MAKAIHLRGVVHLRHYPVQMPDPSGAEHPVSDSALASLYRLNPLVSEVKLSYERMLPIPPPKINHHGYIYPLAILPLF